MESGGREFFAFICLDSRRMEENIKNIAPEVNEEYYDLIELQTKRNNGKMKGGQKNCKSDWFEKRYYGFASCS